MGDNRQISDDSRLRQFDPGGGTIPISQVVGRAFVIVWPPSHWRILPIPSTFSQPGISKSAAAAAGQPSARAPGRPQPGGRRGAAARGESPAGSAVPAAGGRVRGRAAADLAAAPGAAAAGAQAADGPRPPAAVMAVGGQGRCAARRPRGRARRLAGRARSGRPHRLYPRRDVGLSGYERVLSAGRAGASRRALTRLGRGACAGPLVVAAVMLKPSKIAKLTELADSKALTAQGPQCGI